MNERQRFQVLVKEIRQLKKDAETALWHLGQRLNEVFNDELYETVNLTWTEFLDKVEISQSRASQLMSAQRMFTLAEYRLCGPRKALLVGGVKDTKKRVKVAEMAKRGAKASEIKEEIGYKAASKSSDYQRGYADGFKAGKAEALSALQKLQSAA